MEAVAALHPVMIGSVVVKLDELEYSFEVSKPAVVKAVAALLHLTQGTSGSKHKG